MSNRKPPAPRKGMRVVKGMSEVRRPGKKIEKDDQAWSTPIELTPDEQQRFNRMREYLVEKKAWKPLFSDMLAAYIRTASIFALSANNIKKSDDLLQYFRNGTYNISPELSAYFKSIEKLTSIATEFGATPRSSKVIETGQQLGLFDDLPSPFRATR
jgi:phage terminase small subunit